MAEEESHSNDDINASSAEKKVSENTSLSVEIITTRSLFHSLTVQIPVF